MRICALLLAVLPTACCPKLIHREVEAAPPAGATVTRARVEVEAHDQTPAYCPGGFSVLQAQGHGWVTHDLLVEHAGGKTKVPLLLSGEGNGFSEALAEEKYELRFADARTLGIRRGARDGWWSADLSVPDQPFLCVHRVTATPDHAAVRAAIVSLLESVIAGDTQRHFNEPNPTDGTWAREIAGAARVICAAKDDPQLNLLFMQLFVRRSMSSADVVPGLEDCAVALAEQDPGLKALIANGAVFTKPPDFFRDTRASEADSRVRAAQQRLGLPLRTGDVQP